MPSPSDERRLDHLACRHYSEWCAPERIEKYLYTMLYTQISGRTQYTLHYTVSYRRACCAPSCDRRRYLQAFEQREQQRVAGDLVDPRRLLADDMAEQGEGGQPAGVLGHALVHLVQKVLRLREEERRYDCRFETLF